MLSSPSPRTRRTSSRRQPPRPPAKRRAGQAAGRLAWRPLEAPGDPDSGALLEQVARVRRVMSDFERAAAELDRRARQRELLEDREPAVLERAHARQMRLCNARLAAALLVQPQSSQ
jgi:hypothetical protein